LKNFNVFRNASTGVKLKRRLGGSQYSSLTVLATDVTDPCHQFWQRYI